MNLKHLAALYRDERIDNLIICHLDAALTAMLGAKRGRVLLSQDTMRKQRRKHDDLALEEYEIIEAALKLGEYRRDTDSVSVVLFVDTLRFNRNYRLAIKRTKDGRLFVTSFLRLRDRKLEQARRAYPDLMRLHQL